MTDAPTPSLTLTYGEAGKIVEVVATSAQYSTWEGLAAAVPDLPSQAQHDAHLTLELARAFFHLEKQTRQELVESEEALAQAIADWAEPELPKLRRWYGGETISGPPSGTLRGPEWVDGALVLYSYNFDWGSSHRYLFGSRWRLSFGDAWSSEREHVKEQAQLQLTKTAERAAALFGGPVQGFLRASPPLKKECVFLAISAGEAASPVVWFPQGSEPSRYASYAELVSAEPAAGEPAFLAHLADELHSYWADRGVRHGNYKAIPDGAAYLQRYRETNLSTFKLRYWVDHLATWKLTVPELDTVASPRVEGNVLHAYLEGPKYQPYRFVVDLSALTLETAPTTVEGMASEELISDTGGLHGKNLAPGQKPGIRSSRPARSPATSEISEPDAPIPDEPDWSKGV